jgi:hypothetical protein
MSIDTNTTGFPIAEELAVLLNKADRSEVLISQLSASQLTYALEWNEDGADRLLLVDWDPAKSRWIVTTDADEDGA